MPNFIKNIKQLTSKPIQKIELLTYSGLAIIGVFSCWFGFSIVDITPKSTLNTPLFILIGLFILTLFIVILRQFFKRLTDDSDLSDCILQTIDYLNTRYHTSKKTDEIFIHVLTSMIDYFQSDYALIGDISYTENDEISFRPYAIVNQSQGNNIESSMLNKHCTFYELNPLLGDVIATGELVIKNECLVTDQIKQLPGLDEKLTSFMGIPLNSGPQLVGVIVFANHKTKFEMPIYERFSPLIHACANIMDGYVNDLFMQEIQQNINRANQDKLEGIVESIDDGFILINLFKKITYVNSRTYNIFKLNRPVDACEEINNCFPELSELIMPLIDQLMVSKKAVHIEQYFHYLHIWLDIDIYLQPQNISIFIKDITRRKQTEEKLFKQSAKISAIVDNAADGILTINKKGFIQTFNAAAEMMFGYLGNEVIGQHLNKVLSKTSQILNDADIKKFVLDSQSNEKKNVCHCEFEGVRKNGDIFPLELTLNDVMFDHEKIYTGIFRDITDRKKVEKLKSEFISTVSHELRTPLTSIKGSLGLISGGAVGELNEAMKPLIDVAYNNTNRLLALINDILDLEKIESGKLQFMMSESDLVEIVKDSVISNQAYADQLNIKLVILESMDKAMVSCDKGRITQVLTNLISNAVKVSNSGSAVELKLEPFEQSIRVSVIDEGDGIPDDFRSHIFQKFAQVDGSDTRKLPGTGLGLSICKLIVSEHGGEIDYVTELGQGSTFYFDMP